MTDTTQVLQRMPEAWRRVKTRTNSGKFLAAVNYPGEFARIVTIDVENWEMSTVTEIATPALYYVTSLAYDPDSRTAF